MCVCVCSTEVVRGAGCVVGKTIVRHGMCLVFANGVPLLVLLAFHCKFPMGRMAIAHTRLHAKAAIKKELGSTPRSTIKKGQG